MCGQDDEEKEEEYDLCLLSHRVPQMHERSWGQGLKPLTEREIDRKIQRESGRTRERASKW